MVVNLESSFIEIFLTNICETNLDATTENVHQSLPLIVLRELWREACPIALDSLRAVLVLFNLDLAGLIVPMHVRQIRVEMTCCGWRTLRGMPRLCPS